MVVSKRGIVKVIVLLVIIDIIAGFWYLTLRIENSGESHDLWLPNDVTEAADTIADYTVPDTFAVVSNQGYFVTVHPVDSSSSQRACIKKVSARVPLSINGCDSLALLYREIAIKAFDLTSYDIEGAMTRYTSQPSFGTQTTHLYKDVAQEPRLGSHRTAASHVKIYPLSTSHRLLVIAIDIAHNTYGQSNTTSHYVHYDRVAQQVIDNDDIVNTMTETQLLALINEKIASLNASNADLSLHAASRVPGQLCVHSNGTSFIFQPGVIAPVDKGEIEVRISHEDMRNIYTHTFIRILNASTGWWIYKNPFK